jgi:hypothetical protein
VKEFWANHQEDHTHRSRTPLRLRPQTGLDMADIVYESLTEGGITRFNALFHSQTPPEVGPVRSARMSDTQLVPQYSALFAHSGANAGVLSAIRSAGIEVVDHSGASAAYRRASDRACAA